MERNDYAAREDPADLAARIDWKELGLAGVGLVITLIIVIAYLGVRLILWILGGLRWMID